MITKKYIIPRGNLRNNHRETYINTPSPILPHLPSRCTAHYASLFPPVLPATPFPFPSPLPAPFEMPPPFSSTPPPPSLVLLQDLDSRPRSASFFSPILIFSSFPIVFFFLSMQCPVISLSQRQTLRLPPTLVMFLSTTSPTLPPLLFFKVLLLYQYLISLLFPNTFRPLSPLLFSIFPLSPCTLLDAPPPPSPTLSSLAASSMSLLFSTFSSTPCNLFDAPPLLQHCPTPPCSSSSGPPTILPFFPYRYPHLPYCHRPFPYHWPHILFPLPYLLSSFLHPNLTYPSPSLNPPSITLPLSLHPSTFPLSPHPFLPLTPTPAPSLLSPPARLPSLHPSLTSLSPTPSPNPTFLLSPPSTFPSLPTSSHPLPPHPLPLPPPPPPLPSPPHPPPTSRTFPSLPPPPQLSPFSLPTSPPQVPEMRQGQGDRPTHQINLHKARMSLFLYFPRFFLSPLLSSFSLLLSSFLYFPRFFVLLFSLLLFSLLPSSFSISFSFVPSLFLPSLLSSFLYFPRFFVLLFSLLPLFT
ncbi:hypothetical protein C7M84_003751 [Penaeus vannamei]|uniref:Uncharacterized protein n=1 Tax=Penaeus vannamei TaxID=6689 RepID=A0A423TMB9_PENVA|nr:hypothetical protein C7M84_003751 [Penaeus vannamei]